MSDKFAAMPAALLSPDGKRISVRAYCILILLCLAFFIPGLATLPPTDRDESLFAQASKQMLESGNFVDIRIQEEHRYKKPIGIYWLQAASVRILNSAHLNEIWAYRVPSFLSAIIAVLMTAAIGSLLFNPAIGFYAAIMMAGCLILNVEARQAKTDAALLATIMIAQYALVRAYVGKADKWLVPFAFWTAIGAGILIKGPIILLIVCSTLLWLRLTEKNLKWFSALRPRVGILYMLLLTLPWLVAIGIASHGQFFRQSAGHDMLGKVANGEFRGMIPPGVHLLAFPLVFFPFSIFGLLAIPDAWANRRDPAVRLCLGWIIPAWIVFEISLTKLPHYTMPMYPAIALLAVKALMDGFPALAERRWRWLPPLAMGLWLMAGTALGVGIAIFPYIVDHTWNVLAIGAGFLLLNLQGVGLFFVLQRKTGSISILAAGSLILAACAFGNMLPSLQHMWVSRQVVQMAEVVKKCDRLQIISATYNEPSLIFLAGTDTQFTPSGADAAMDMWYHPCKIGVIDEEHAKLFFDTFPNKSYQPIALGSVEGFNIGRGRPIKITLYTLPQPSAIKP